MIFQNIYDDMLRIREEEKSNNLAILTRIGRLTVHIYANSPLRFNIYVSCDWIRAKEEPMLQFCEKVLGEKRSFVVSVRNLDDSTVTAHKEFKLHEDIKQLVEKFPSEPQIGEIVKEFLLYNVDRED